MREITLKELSTYSEEDLERLLIAVNDGQGDCNIWTGLDIKSWIGAQATGEDIYNYIWSAVDNDGNMIDFVLIEDNAPVKVWLVE